MDKHQVQRLWEKSLVDVAKELTHGDPGSPNNELRLGIIQARAAYETARMATWTRALALATIILALATVALVAVTASC